MDRFLIGLFVAIRLINILTAYIAPHFVPYLGFFPYKEIFYRSHFPPYIFSFANFDGVHYIRTALMGYSQYAQAFFPLYPLLIRFVGYGIHNPILTGLFISYISFFIGLYYFRKYLLTTGYSKNQATWTLIHFSAFPTAFFFGAVYNMSLFFCLATGALYFFHKKKYIGAGVFSVFAAITRLEGIFLFIPFVLPLFLKKQPIKPNYLFALGSPIVGLFTFMAYLWRTTGDPLFFLHSQEAFGANRSSKLITLPQVLYRYIKIFLTANHDFRYLISVFEFVTFLFVFCVLLIQLYYLFKKRHDIYFSEKLGLHVFSLCVIILPTLTGTLSSTPRYALLALAFFAVLGSIKNKGIQIIIAVFFFLMQSILLAFFIQGYFIS